MQEYNQRNYYRLKEEIEKDPNYLDTLIDTIMNEPLRLVFWNDHIAEFGNVRKETVLSTDAGGNQIVQHDRFDGNVFQDGTPVDAYNLGKMEWNDLINYVQNRYILDQMRKMMIEFATLKGGISNNMPFNSFIADMTHIDEDIVILEGWYDMQNSRGVV